MTDIPLIFVHKGDASYLKQVLAHNYAFNKSADIYLLGDEKNSSYANVKHYPIKNYSRSANEFADIYRHMSTNSYEFELFCFQRWFVINEFAQSMKLESFLCLDSDVLLYCNVNDIFSHFVDYDFTISQRHSPHITLFNRQSLADFCNYLTQLYTRPEYIERFTNTFNEFSREKRLGGICDMSAFFLYPEDVSENVKDVSEKVDEFYFDSNLNESDGFEMSGGLKKIYWKDNLPFAKHIETGLLVQLLGLHFQGATKWKLHKFVLNENLKRPGVAAYLRRLFSRKD